ncbi:MAG: CHAD domain-containing protein, partial [Candidatus Binataceae bacterium]
MTAVRRPARAHPAAPSPTDSAVKVATASIGLQLRAMTAEHGKALAGDAEAIHRLRVATRRLRAALRMLREIAPGHEAENAADELGWLCGAIGAVRDLDVLAQMLEQRATRLEADFIRALAPLSDTIRHQRAIEQERLVAALDSERYRGLVQRLGTVAPEAAADSVTLG